MNFKIYRNKLIFYILMLIASCSATIYFSISSSFWLLAGWTFLLVITFSILLIRESEKNKRELYNFISSITYGEFKNSYKSRREKDDLAQAFDDLICVYRNLSSEKEKNHLFLQTIVEHINMAILCFDKNGDIVIINEAAKQFFGRSYIINLDVVKRFNKPLSVIINDIKNGQKKLYKFSKLGNTYNVSIHATEFKLQDKPYKLVSIQDVRFELEEQELDSWRKLVRVLTHEIMNTAIPISTLAGVTNQFLLDDNGAERNLATLNKEDQNDLRHSLKTIEKRSKGMVEFVQATKSYTNMPAAKFEQINLKQITESVLNLLEPGLKSKGVDVSLKTDDQIPDMNLDAKLIEQLLINIIKNAVEAMEKVESPKLKIAVLKETMNKFVVEIEDNGSGMDSDMMENIFVPFYTTKKEGSGIGLSLSRQIMRLHGGSIQISSEIEKGTNVKLIFNN